MEVGRIDTLTDRRLCQVTLTRSKSVNMITPTVSRGLIMNCGCREPTTQAIGVARGAVGARAPPGRRKFLGAIYRENL